MELLSMCDLRLWWCESNSEKAWKLICGWEAQRLWGCGRGDGLFSRSALLLDHSHGWTHGGPIHPVAHMLVVSPGISYHRKMQVYVELSWKIRFASLGSTKYWSKKCWCQWDPSIQQLSWLCCVHTAPALYFRSVIAFLSTQDLHRIIE